MYQLEIEVSTQETDANRRRGKHWSFSHSADVKIKTEIYWLSKDKLPEKPLEKFLLSITRHGAKKLDYDNLIGSFKPAIDGLVKAKIIKDDNWTYIKHIDVDQVISPHRKLVIKVDEL
jgi:Holliday junction resolvase RusA-like endonuclease